MAEAQKASGCEGIRKDWLCTTAIVTALERLTEVLERTNALLSKQTPTDNAQPTHNSDRRD